jgi:trehalose 6-phosphate phosphatase
VDALLAPLAAAPAASAILLDVDGVLAPIAPRPELAEVPEETRDELRRLAARYLLVACLSGRAGDDARRLVGVPEVEVVGNHGLELDGRADAYAAAVARFRDEVSLPVEDKRLTLAYHFREASNEAAARVELDAVAARAREAGLVARWGRKVLEIRPPLDADKGTAVRALLERSGARRALFAGDDTTDLDAFAALAAAELDHAVRVAVVSPEAPPRLVLAADLAVDGPGEFLAILREL